MKFLVNCLFVFLIVLPFFIKGVLATFLVDGVLKYQVKHKKAVYILLALIGAGFGAFESIVSVSNEGNDIIIGEVESLILYGVMVIVLAVSINTKWWKKIVISFLAVDILTSVDQIFEVLGEQIVGSNNWNTMSIAMSVVILLGLLIQLLEFAFLYFLKRLRSKNDNAPLPVTVTLTIALLLNVLVSVFPDLTEDADFIDSRKALTIMSMLVILVFLALFFYIRVTRKERDDLKELNHINEELVASQTMFFEATAKSDNEIRAMRHDMRNNTNVLKLLLEKGEYEKMREYLEEMGENLESADISAHTGDTIADAIIADKTSKAEALGITLKSSGKISGIEISPVDMCKILANLLDNAIEASTAPELSELQHDIKQIELQFRKTENFFMISVSNPCFKAPEIEDGRIVTSKNDRKNHGFGIHNIETAAYAYGGELTVSCEERPYGFLFLAEVVFPVTSEEPSDISSK